MATEPRCQDDVIVHLNTLNRSEPVPNRRLLLTKEAPVMPIGRTSKRKTSLGRSESNAFFDCPVMSRNHAELRLDTKNRKIFLSDTGSLHGTLHNKVSLRKGELRTLESGDILSFGQLIDRGAEKYTPYEVEAKVTWGTTKPQDEAVTYSVPDDSDVEEVIDETHDPDGMAYARKVLWENNFHPASRPQAIDLTSNTRHDTLGCDREKLGARPWVTNSTIYPRPRKETSQFIDLTSPGDNVHEHEQKLGTPTRNNLNTDHPVPVSVDGPQNQEAQLADDEPEGASNVDEDQVYGSETNYSESEHDVLSLEPSSIEPSILDEEEADDASIFNEDEEDDLEEHNELDYEEPPAPESSHHFGQPMRDEEHAQPSTDSLIWKWETCPQNEGGPPSPLDGESLETRAKSKSALGDRPDVPSNPDSATHLFFQPPENSTCLQSREDNPNSLGIPSLGDSGVYSEMFGRDRTQGSNPHIREPLPPLNESLIDAGSDLSNDLARSGNYFLNSPLDRFLPEVASRAKSPALDETSAYMFELSKKGAGADSGTFGVDARVAEVDVRGAAGADTRAAESEITVETKGGTRSTPDKIKQVQVEKKTPNIERAGSTRAMGIKDIIESPATDKAHTVKRKAVDISRSTPEEEEVVDEKTLEISPPTQKKKAIKTPQASETPTPEKASPQNVELAAVTPIQSLTRPSCVIESFQFDSTRPAKRPRLRRAAEALGYAAVGGIAVMSALIATAPAL